MSHPFGFKTSVAPQLVPLQNSHATDDIEAGLYQLALDLFKQFENPTFNAINAGAGHLGTADFVKRSMNRDGLTMLASEREDQLMRYLYRAWKASDQQGRGLHFLRTYLQMLYPNEWELWHFQQPKAMPYPTFLEPWEAGSEVKDGFFLTSRISVKIDGNNRNAPLLGNFIPILQSVIPARLLVDFSTFKQATAKVELACQIEGLGHSQPRPVLDTTIRLPAMVDAAIAGVIDGKVIPIGGLSTLSTPTAVLFGHNNRPPLECANVCIVAAEYCCSIVHGLDPITQGGMRVPAFTSAAITTFMRDTRTDTLTWDEPLGEVASELRTAVYGQIVDRRTELFMSGFPHSVPPVVEAGVRHASVSGGMVEDSGD